MHSVVVIVLVQSCICVRLNPSHTSMWCLTETSDCWMAILWELYYGSIVRLCYGLMVVTPAYKPLDTRTKHIWLSSLASKMILGVPDALIPSAEYIYTV